MRETIISQYGDEIEEFFLPECYDDLIVGCYDSGSDFYPAYDLKNLILYIKNNINKNSDDYFNSEILDKNPNVCFIEFKSKDKETLATPNLDMMFMCGFDNALAGLKWQKNREIVPAYDKNKCIDILMENDGMSYEDALEYYDFNIEGAYMGVNTPAMLTLY